MPRLGLGQSLTGGAVSDEPAFVSTWLTTSSTETIALPLSSHASFETIVVKWGDGSSDTITAYDDAGSSHEYTDGAGTKTITITGNIYGMNFFSGASAGTHRTKLKTITSWGGFVMSGYQIFRNCTGLTAITASDAPTITGTEVCKYLFRGCSTLTDINQGEGEGDTWDVSSVTNFYLCFNACVLFNGSVNTWDTSSGTNFHSCFLSCYVYNQPMNNWRFPTSGTINFTSMLQECRVFNQDISDWNTVRVTDMTGFLYAAYLWNNGGEALPQVTGKWDVSNVVLFDGTFRDTAFNQSVADWDTGSAVTMYRMFRNVTEFNQDISHFDTADVTTMRSMFQGATSYVGTGVDSFDIAEVTNMTDMFNGANALTTANYNALLIAWEGQTEQADVTFHAGDATYTGSTAITARAALVDSGWTITDGGEG